MFEKYSSEQAAHITTLAAFVSLIARSLGYDIAENDIVTVLSALVGVVAVAYSYYKRYQRGDLKLSGARK